MVKYHVEGEKNMPFNLGKIIVISSATTTPNLNEQSEEIQENYLWQENVIQTNDVYIYIDKNEKFKEDEIIKNVRIENIQILKNVKLGNIQVYMPNSLDGELYKYTNDKLLKHLDSSSIAILFNKSTFI